MSVRQKHPLHLAIKELVRFDSWDGISENALQGASRAASRGVDRVLAREASSLWAQPLRPEEAATRFQLSQVLLDKAQARRSQARGSAMLSTAPAVVNGRVASQYLKNGEALRGAYQTLECLNAAGECAGHHRCGVLRASGRVCGGHHPAMECRERRYLHPEAMPSAPAPPPLPTRSVEELPLASMPPWRRVPVTPPKAPATPPKAPAAPPLPLAKTESKAVAAASSKYIPSRPASARAERSRSPRRPREEAPAELPAEIPIPASEMGSRLERRFDRLATVGGKSAEVSRRQPAGVLPRELS